MLPKKNRLTLKADFQKVLKSGRMAHGRFYALSVLKVEDDGKKFGIIVSNKISKSAVKRNFIRRAARSATHKNIDDLRNGILGVFLAKPQAVGQTFENLEEDAKALVSKL